MCCFTAQFRQRLGFLAFCVSEPPGCPHVILSKQKHSKHTACPTCYSLQRSRCCCVGPQWKAPHPEPWRTPRSGNSRDGTSSREPAGSESAQISCIKQALFPTDNQRRLLTPFVKHLMINTCFAYELVSYYKQTNHRQHNITLWFFQFCYRIWCILQVSSPKMFLGHSNCTLNKACGFQAHC